MRVITKTFKGKERQITDNEIINEFKKYSRVSLHTGRYHNSGKKVMESIPRDPGTYCERCGRIFSIRNVYQNGKAWKGFYICIPCYEDKINGELEQTPDLEDLIKIRNNQLK